ncbi:hypothetical protein SELMODRAFT_86083 [Selaginella moellendorffii]|uniref:Uncharacterized protein n=1 Tax=Selaginella moellendorffii TaxID=88036 RepID=D8R625_SELML|nr:hypothetical protein SELMODRAFT_86083 [Selaginella moellendorffii]
MKSPGRSGYGHLDRAGFVEASQVLNFWLTMFGLRHHYPLTIKGVEHHHQEETKSKELLQAIPVYKKIPHRRLHRQWVAGCSQAAAL